MENSKEVDKNELDSSLGSEIRGINKYSVFPVVNEEASRNLLKVHDEQKICFLCRAKMSDSGIIDKKKYACMFCYNAVCQSCSPLKCVHPRTKKEERVCMQCYFTAIEEKVKRNVNNNKSIDFRGSGGFKNKIELENRIKDCQEEIENFDNHIKNAEEEFRRLEAAKSKDDQENIKKMKKIEEKKKLEMDVLRINLEQIERKIEVESKKLKEKENEVVELRKKLEEKGKYFSRLEEEIERQKLANEAHAIEDAECLNSDKDRYNEELNKLKTELDTLEDEQIKLKKELSDFERKNK